MGGPFGLESVKQIINKRRQGGGVVPYHEISIRLVSEEIDIHLGRDGYDVGVSYLFSNTGSATALTMGFPNETDWMYGIAIPDFRAWVDGDEQEISRRMYQETDKPYGPESAPDSYYECFDISFATGQRRRVRNVYSQDCLVDYDMSGSNLGPRITPRPTGTSADGVEM